jgi:Kef-type K+ transport system membrane component KefB
MASVVSSLGDTSGSRTSLGWVIGRPIMAAGLLTLVFPSFTRLALRPIYMRYLRAAAHRFSPHDHTAVTILAIAGLCSAAAYAGTSILYGAYLAGASLAYLDTNTATPSSPSSSSISERATFQAVFHRVIAPVQHALLEPLFFASIGFAIPIRRAWHGTIVWQGVVYALLMGAAKLLVGACVPVWVVAARVFRAPPQRVRETLRPTAILGAAMVARGEIGLLVLELGYVQAARVSERGFLVGLWAVVLNTLLGPIVTGALMHRMGEQVRKGPWGDVKRDQ